MKNFTTAEGGAVTWRDIPGMDNEVIYHQYQLLSLHGQSKDALAKTQLGAWEYDIVGPWYKCNMTDVVAGIGLAQMKRYPGMLSRRKEIIARYDAAFRPLGIETLNHYTEFFRASVYYPSAGDYSGAEKRDHHQNGRRRDCLQCALQAVADDDCLQESRI